jgi:hypothetical protein
VTDFFQSGNLTIAAFQPSQLGILALPNADGTVTPIGPGDVLTYAPNIDAAINGPMYDTCGGADDASASCDIVDFLQYDSQRGVSLPGSRPGQGIVISVVNGVATASDTIAVPPGASVSVQCYPSIVENSVTTNPADSTVEMRSALAILNDGRLAFALAQEGATMPQFAQALMRAGATYAGYTDGGGSAHLVTQSGIQGATEQRRVATWLTAGGGSIASATDWLTSLGLIAVAGGIFWWVSRKRT